MFFDLSNRANNNNEQNLYFESMRELRIKKAGLINNFSRELEHLFRSCLQPGPKSSSRLDNDDSNQEPLSLVQDDEIEKGAAINGMISKARVDCQEALYTLTMRLDHIVAGNRISEDNNPIDPLQLCTTFAEACELLEIPIKAKIIIYKQFQRLVCNQLTGLYTTANDLLINAGVLPKISHSIKRQDSTQASQAEEPSQTEAILGRSDGVSYSLDELQNMLEQVRQIGLHLHPNYALFTANPGPLMSNQDLLLALAELEIDEQQLRDSSNIRDTINLILSQANPQQPQALTQPDEDIINLVSMFFDFVLDDKNLPVPIQALISRLQIPILKIALHDRSFFSNGEHPARRTVNLVASIGFGWNDEEDSAQHKLYQQVAQIIHDIAASGEATLTLFEQQARALEALCSQLERRSNLVEKRAQQAAEGQARTHQARQKVQESLLQQLENCQLPAFISDFIIEYWQQLLVMSHIKHGEDSPVWLNALQVSQDLIWACQNQSDEKSLQRLEKLKPQLLEQLTEGLAEITLADHERLQLLEELEQQLAQAGSGAATKQPLSAKQLQQLGRGEGEAKSWQEMTAVERQQAKHTATTYEFIQKAEALPLDSWINYQDHQQGRVLRCKLSAKIAASDSYIFVNSFGFKVLEKKRKDFAYDLQQKHALVLEKAQLFDRALSSVVNNIRNLSPA
jgi:hypothetical protein